MRDTATAGSGLWVALRVLLLFVLGLALLGRGLQYMNDRFAARSQARIDASAAAADAARRAADDVPRPRPTRAPAPATDEQLRLLYEGSPDQIGHTLRLVAGAAPGPELQAALDAADLRSTSPDTRRFIACVRARDPESAIGDAFAALPSTPAGEGEWRTEGTRCLIDAIAARAEEDRDRALEPLAWRAVDTDAPAVRDALTRLDPAALPAPIADVVERGADRLTYGRAVTAAIAAGAAASRPDLVDGWLDAADRGLRLRALEALVRRRDDAALARAARALASNPGDDAVQEIAMRPDARKSGLDRHLAALAADGGAPAFARAHAAVLVSRHGDADACRAVLSLQSTDATLAPELADATRRIAARFGASFRERAD